MPAPQPTTCSSAPRPPSPKPAALRPAVRRPSSPRPSASRTVRAASGPRAGPHGDRESAGWTALLAHARTAAARVLRLPANHPDVEDRAQDALVAFLASGRAAFDPALGTLAAYVATIARNLARSHLRDRATRARLGGLYRAEPAVALSHLRAEAPHRRVEAARDLGHVLERLCPGHAEALLRIDLAGEPIGEAARHLGKSYVAMNGQVGHARAAARRVARELELMAA